MGFHEGAYATVWEITNQGDNFSKVRLSISRKDKKSDEYVTDFNGFVGLVGEANKKLNLIDSALSSGDRCRIKIGACDVSNKYNKDEGREYTNFTMFDFELSDRAAQSDDRKSAKATKKKTKAKPAALADEESSEEDDEDLPF